MLEMKRLRLLWELHARGTVAAVAEALNYSPSAVSQQLGILEREAGVPLLRKTGRTLELTAAGEALVAEAEKLLAGLERAESALHRARSEVGGTIRLAVFQTAMLALVPGALSRLRERYPGLRVEVVQGEPGAALRETWARGFEPDVRFETADLQAHVRLIETGNAAALLPGLVRTGERLRIVDLPGRPHRSIFTAARASRGAHPALAAVRDALAASAAELRLD